MKTSTIITLGVIGAVIFLIDQKKDDIISYVDNNFPDFGGTIDDIVTNISSGVDSIKENFSSGVAYVSSLFSDLYNKWASLTGLDPALIQAVAMTESDETPTAIGDGGKSFGLMQIQNAVGSMYANATGNDLLNPDTNIEAGSKYLSDLINKYGIEGGIQAYNLGETKYRAGLTSPVYLSKVLANYNKLKAA